MGIGASANRGETGAGCSCLSLGALDGPSGGSSVSLTVRMSRTVYLTETKEKAKPRKLFAATPGSASELIWLSDTTVAYLNGTTMHHFSIKHDPIRTMHLLDLPKGTEPSALTYEPESHLLVFSAAVWGADSSLEETAKGDKKWDNRGTSAYVYDDLFVRHWDTWRIPGRVYTLAATELHRKKKDEEEVFEASSRFTNLLAGTGLYSQVDAISKDQFSVSPKEIALAIKPTDIDPALHTRLDVYLLPHKGGKVTQLTSTDHGAVSGVRFSPGGKKLAWLQMAQDGYESDRRVVMVYTPGLVGGSIEAWTQKWDRSPSYVNWDLDGDSLYVLAEHHGKDVPYHLDAPGALPTPLHFHGSTSSITQVRKDLFLLSISSFTSPTELFLLDLEDEAYLHSVAQAVEDHDHGRPGRGHGDPDKRPPEALHQLTHFAEKHIGGRLDKIDIDALWFRGDEDWRVMAWVLKPPGYSEDDSAKWPLAFLIHGGPQGAWTESWSTRWNPAVYAAAGYVVVAVNPTGSTGYGQEFTDRIARHWGSRPFRDLLLGYRAALEHYPGIDKERTAALGASYGGYMVNSIQGHNEFGFKALVYHDGMLSTTTSYYETEELWFPTHDFGGTPTSDRDAYEEYNPMNYVQNWHTPQLVLQGGMDFRLPVTQALGTFTALQVRGVPSRLVYFPDENHWVLKAANSRKWHHEVFAWLDKYVGKGKNGPKNDSAPEEAQEEPQFVIQQ